MSAIRRFKQVSLTIFVDSGTLFTKRAKHKISQQSKAKSITISVAFVSDDTIRLEFSLLNHIYGGNRISYAADQCTKTQLRQQKKYIK